MKRMFLFVAMMIPVLHGFAVTYGEKVADADSASFFVDSRVESFRTVGPSEFPIKVTYSGYNWNTTGSSSQSATVTVDTPLAVEPLGSATGEGIVLWTPHMAGTHMLKHVCNGATQLATVEVEGPKVKIVRRKDAGGNTFYCEIVSEPAGCAIYYTTDSSMPTTVSERYDGPFMVDPIHGTIVHAMAVSDTGVESRPVAVNFAPLGIEIVASASSGEFKVDGRAGTDEDLPSEGVEELTFSNLWDGDADATVTIAQDGAAIFEGLSGEGVKTWAVDRNGRYVLTHTTYTNGVKGKVETAVFVVEGKEVPVSELTIDWGQSSFVYDGQPKKPAITVKDGATTLTKDTHYLVEYKDNVNVGAAKAIVKGLDPYVGEVMNEFTIAPATVTVTADAKSKVFGTADPALTYVASGLLGADSLTGALAREPGETVGAYDILQGTLTVGPNYTLDFTGATFTISQTPIIGPFGPAEPDIDPDTGLVIIRLLDDQGPIVIPDNLGPFILDLNGHSITGVCGSAESGNFDGGPALTIVHVESGEGTSMIIRNSDPEGHGGIFGGDGADGTTEHPAGGNGGPGILIEDAAIAPSVTVEENVLVRGGHGGDGYAGSGADGGNGGAGIEDRTTEPDDSTIVNGGTIEGGDGGDGADGTGDTPGGNGGNGGAGVDGDVDDNTGTITGGNGGNGGDSESGSGGNGGGGEDGVSGDVGSNEGTITGGNGGDGGSSGSGDGGNGGNGGSGVGGDVGDNTGTITDGEDGTTVLTETMVSLAEGPWVYARADIEPAVTVTSGGSVLVKGVDFTVQYLNNVNVGQATARITGIGTCEGMVAKTFVISPKPLTVKADAKTQAYGEAAKALTYTTVGMCSGDALMGALTREPGEDAGEYDILIGTLANGNYTISFTGAKYTITKAVFPGGGEEPGGGTIPEGGLSKFDTVTMYDGEGWTIKTNDLIAAFKAAVGGEVTVSYARGGAGVPALPWMAVAPDFTNVCVTSVWYKVTSANYLDFMHEAKVTVTNRSVTLTSGTETFDYDGNAHSNMTVTISGEGFVAGEGVTTNNFATITEKGSKPNAFGYELILNPGSVAENYRVTSVTGTLTVASVANAWIVEPTVTGKAYDGTPAAVTMGKPKFGTVSVTYDGGQTAAPVVAGNHTAKFTVAATADYGALEKVVNYTIGKVVVDEPLIASKTYNEQAQVADIAGSVCYTVVRNNGGTMAGRYAVVLQLVDAVNYRWASSVDATIILPFEITSDENAWTSGPTAPTSVIGSGATFPVATAKYGDVEVRYSGTVVDGTVVENALQIVRPGTYTATFKARTTSSWSELTAGVPLTVSAEGSVSAGALKALSAAPVSVSGVKSMSIPRTWFSKYQGFTAKFGNDLSKAALMKTGKLDGNGREMQVWQDYVAGTDPTKEDSRLSVKIEFRNGKPKISWTPNQNANEERVGNRVYTVWGKKTLTDEEWTPNVDETTGEWNFFKVTVDMPEKE